MAQDRQPNVLFLLSDDQRADAISAYGNQVVKTPHIDSLVSRGTSFMRSYCMGSWSGAVCMPSRSMIMSGRTLWRSHGRLNNHQTFPETFRKAGYQTFGTGKWHASIASFERSFEVGSAVFLGGMSRHEAVPIRRLADGKLDKKPKKAGFSSTLFADAAIQFLNERDRKRPFMAYVSFTAPHDPRTPPAKWKRTIDPLKIPLPANFMSRHPFPNGEMRIRDEKLLGWPRTKVAVQQELANYYELIGHMDSEIGRILAALRATGDDKNTLIVFASDHGLAIGSHGLLGKQNPYEHSIRAPLVLAGPGIAVEQRKDALCYLLDIFPTVAEACGVPAPTEVEGKSLWSILQGKTKSHRRYIYNAYKSVQRTLVSGQYKLILHSVAGVKSRQLFDLSSDPDELNNIIDSDRGKRISIMLQSALSNIQNEIGDTCFGNPKQEKVAIQRLRN